MTKDEFIVAMEEHCIRIPMKRLWPSAPATFAAEYEMQRDHAEMILAYREMATKLLEGLEGPWLKAFGVKNEEVWKLTLPKEQSE